MLATKVWAYIYDNARAIVNVSSTHKKAAAPLAIRRPLPKPVKRKAKNTPA
jgi:hypothetical protein